MFYKALRVGLNKQTFIEYVLIGGFKYVNTLSKIKN